MTAAIQKSELSVSNQNPSSYVLPKGNFLPYSEFKKSFQLGNASTEQLHPETMELSQSMHLDIVEGLSQLITADATVVEGYRTFITYLPTLASNLKNSINSNGRIIIVGSGSSGRVAKSLAKKCNDAFPERKGKVIGVIAGGDSAMVRAKEGFEDSDKDGEKAIENLNVNKNDTVILLSASGSASFNVGAGHAAANLGAQVFYFYNSKEVPDRTQLLFQRKTNPVRNICVDIGPQAIAGSTRLQAATLAQICLGALLGTVLDSSANNNHLGYDKQILTAIETGNSIIENKLESFKSFIEQMHLIHCSPQANTHRVSDSSDLGYVTFISLEDCFPEICIDTTELPPTFNEPFYRREGEKDQKRPGFQAYMIGKDANQEAWEALLGTQVEKTDLSEVSNFLLSMTADGQNSYDNRPKGKGNMVVGILKLNGNTEFSKAMEDAIRKAKNCGAMTGLIVISDKQITLEQQFKIDESASYSLVLDNMPNDFFGLSQSVLLKQSLNLLSNATMVLAGNVYGNRMINMRASNNKLIDRCIGLIKNIWVETHNEDQLDDEMLYYLVVNNVAKINDSRNKGIEPPPIIAITLAMLHFKKTPEDFEYIVEQVMSSDNGLAFLNSGKKSC